MYIYINTYITHPSPPSTATANCKKQTHIQTHISLSRSLTHTWALLHKVIRAIANGKKVIIFWVPTECSDMLSSNFFSPEFPQRKQCPFALFISVRLIIPVPNQKKTLSVQNYHEPTRPEFTLTRKCVRTHTFTWSPERFHRRCFGWPCAPWSWEICSWRQSAPHQPPWRPP